jgi:hypothetical protein
VKKNTYSLAEAIMEDARRKMALDKEFLSFYERMKGKIKAKPELSDLEVPLDRVRDTVQAAAYGFVFGVPMVTVEEPENWEEAANPDRARPKT